MLRDISYEPLLRAIKSYARKPFYFIILSRKRQIDKNESQPSSSDTPVLDLRQYAGYECRIASRHRSICYDKYAHDF